MAFFKRPRELPGLVLCGTPLPWVDQLKHLGNHISNSMDGNLLDMKVKRASYIYKNNSLVQEFHFAHPLTKVQLNNIYNTHFTGSQLWKIGSREYEKFEATYNRSVKVMFDLPVATHRYFIQPISGFPHMSRSLVRRYLSFIVKVKESNKVALKELLNIVQKDVRMTTGSNLRNIMILAGVNRIDDLEAAKVDFDYHPVNGGDEWRIDFVRELVDVQNEELRVEGLARKEVEEILEYLCCS